MAKIAITCRHCGNTFQWNLTSSQTGSSGAQCPANQGGCSKHNRVYYQNGKVTRITKQ